MFMKALFFVRAPYSVLKNRFGALFEIFSRDVLIIVMGVVMVAGILICVISTYFVVNRLVALKKDELYY